MPGLVVVNADDWGLDAHTTDSILTCFESSSISSTTAMIWMEDSDRAAALGRERGLAAGLHLNLDTPFTDSKVPTSVRRAHERVVPWFASHPRHLATYNASRKFQRDVDASIASQLESFRTEYDREPTHIDGHHQVHVAWNVVTSRALPPDIAVRTTHSRSVRRHRIPDRAIRWCHTAWLRHRFRTTDFLFDIRQIHPDLGGTRARELDAARSATIEVMTHPGVEDEYRVLQSGPWHSFLTSIRLGSFSDLPRHRP
jgi:chitin disaccharide deacetylase